MNLINLGLAAHIEYANKHARTWRVGKEQSRQVYSVSIDLPGGGVAADSGECDSVIQGFKKIVGFIANQRGLNADGLVF